MSDEDDFELPPPKRKPRQLPPHWRKMWKDMMEARTVHMAVPSHPLYKIARFDAWKLIGQGGYGAVFEVIDPELDRHVALKLCLTRGPKAAEAITREARIMAKLSHPSIITVYETGKFGEDVFFIMELVRGADGKFRNSGTHFAAKRPHWRDAIKVYRQVARGLAAAHEAGVIHGDFKPGNVLIDGTGRPRIADFGLAQVLADHEPEDDGSGIKHRMGTLHYMAPEVLRGEPGGVLADQYSFCVALWETVEGTRPHVGRSSADLLVAIGEDEPFALRPPGEVPAKLRELLAKGLSLYPEDRHESMEALADELDALMSEPEPDEGGDDGDGGAPGGGAPPGEGRPPGGILFFLSMGAAFCVMLGALGYAFLSRSARTPEADGQGEAAFEEVSSSSSMPDSFELALAPILEKIEEGAYDDVDGLWAEFVATQPDLWTFLEARLRISEAYLEAALRAEARGEAVDAATAAMLAEEWALQAKLDPSETDTPAARAHEQATGVLDRLRASDASRSR